MQCRRMLLYQNPLSKYHAKSWSYKLQATDSMQLWVFGQKMISRYSVYSAQTPAGGGMSQRSTDFKRKTISLTWALLFLLNCNSLLWHSHMWLTENKIWRIYCNIYIFKKRCKHRAAMFLPSYCTNSWTVLMFLVEWEKLVPLENKSLHYIKI